MLDPIRFGTDGWRARIDGAFTGYNVRRLTVGLARWMQMQGHTSAIVGFDTRHGGKFFAETVAGVLSEYGVQVFLDDSYVATPMLSYGVVDVGADLGIMLTASHNPADYQGYKLKSSWGGPLETEHLRAIEALVSGDQEEMRQFESTEPASPWQPIDLRQRYETHLRASFNISSLQQLSGQMAYDSMFGAGQFTMLDLFPDAVHLHAVVDPDFGQLDPEPLARNLDSLLRTVGAEDRLTFGLAHDGDADRIGMCDHLGNFIDPHRLMLLLLYYLVEYKGLTKGRVVCSASMTDRLEILADQYGVEVVRTPIGFKYISPHMYAGDVILAGEEAGGIAVMGHLPERDGIWAGLILMEMLQATGQQLSTLIDQLMKRVGHFAYRRNDVHLTEDQKAYIIASCAGGISNIGPFPVLKTDTLDGFKFFLEGDQWLMVRPSGTEPVLRLYAQAPDVQQVDRLLRMAKKQWLPGNDETDSNN